MTNFWQGLETFVSEKNEKKQVEFRLYYDKTGNPLFYTTDAEDGEYIIVDRETYVRADYTNIKIRNGKIMQKHQLDSTKLIQHESEGTRTHVSDVSIVEDEKSGQYWKVKTYEYR